MFNLKSPLNYAKCKICKAETEQSAATSYKKKERKHKHQRET